MNNKINENELTIKYNKLGQAKQVKFISSEYLAIGDYSGAGLLGDCNIDEACRLINRKGTKIDGRSKR